MPFAPSVSVPYLPWMDVPLAEVVPVAMLSIVPPAPSLPVRTPVMLNSLRLLSGSLSLPRTSPLTDAVFSSRVLVSSTATGGSLRPSMVMVSVDQSVVRLMPWLSLMA